MSAELYAEIERLVAEGKSDDEINSYLDTWTPPVLEQPKMEAPAMEIKTEEEVGLPEQPDPMRVRIEQLVIEGKSDDEINQILDAEFKQPTTPPTSQIQQVEEKPIPEIEQIFQTQQELKEEPIERLYAGGGMITSSIGEGIRKIASGLHVPAEELNAGRNKVYEERKNDPVLKGLYARLNNTENPEAQQPVEPMPQPQDPRSVMTRAIRGRQEPTQQDVQMDAMTPEQLREEIDRIEGGYSKRLKWFDKRVKEAQEREESVSKEAVSERMKQPVQQYTDWLQNTLGGLAEGDGKKGNIITNTAKRLAERFQVGDLRDNVGQTVGRLATAGNINDAVDLAISSEESFQKIQERQSLEGGVKEISPIEAVKGGAEVVIGERYVSDLIPLASGFVKGLSGSLAEMMPFMGKRMAAAKIMAKIPVAGPLLSVEMSKAQGMGEIISDITREVYNLPETKDLPDDQKRALIVKVIEDNIGKLEAGSTVYALVEKAQADQAIKFFSDIMGKGARAFILNSLKGGLYQSAEEAAQKALTKGAGDIAMMSTEKEDGGKVLEKGGWRAAFDIASEAGKEFVNTLPSMVVTAAVGRGAGIITNKALGIDTDLRDLQAEYNNAIENEDVDSNSANAVAAIIGDAISGNIDIAEAESLLNDARNEEMTIIPLIDSALQYLDGKRGQLSKEEAPAEVSEEELPVSPVSTIDDAIRETNSMVENGEITKEEAVEVIEDTVVPIVQGTEDEVKITDYLSQLRQKGEKAAQEATEKKVEDKEIEEALAQVESEENVTIEEESPAAEEEIVSNPYVQLTEDELLSQLESNEDVRTDAEEEGDSELVRKIDKEIQQINEALSIKNEEKPTKQQKAEEVGVEDDKVEEPTPESKPKQDQSETKAEPVEVTEREEAVVEPKVEVLEDAPTPKKRVIKKPSVSEEYTPEQKQELEIAQFEDSVSKEIAQSINRKSIPKSLQSKIENTDVAFDELPSPVQEAVNNIAYGINESQDRVADYGDVVSAILPDNVSPDDVISYIRNSIGREESAFKMEQRYKSEAKEAERVADIEAITQEAMALRPQIESKNLGKNVAAIDKIVQKLEADRNKYRDAINLTQKEMAEGLTAEERKGLGNAKRIIRNYEKEEEKLKALTKKVTKSQYEELSKSGVTSDRVSQLSQFKEAPTTQEDISFDFGENIGANQEYEEYTGPMFRRTSESDQRIFDETVIENIPEAIWKITDVVVAPSFESDGKTYSLGETDRGAIFKNGNRYSVYISPDIDSKQFARTLVHELIGHAGVTNVLNSQPQIEKKLKALFRSDASKVAREDIENTYSEELSAMNKDQSEQFVFDEWIAKVMEDRYSEVKIGKFSRMVKKASDLLSDWLYKISNGRIGSNKAEAILDDLAYEVYKLKEAYAYPLSSEQRPMFARGEMENAIQKEREAERKRKEARRKKQSEKGELKEDDIIGDNVTLDIPKLRSQVEIALDARSRLAEGLDMASQDRYDATAQYTNDLLETIYKEYGVSEMAIKHTSYRAGKRVAEEKWRKKLAEQREKHNDKLKEQRDKAIAKEKELKNIKKEALEYIRNSGVTGKEKSDAIASTLRLSNPTPTAVTRMIESVDKIIERGRRKVAEKAFKDTLKKLPKSLPIEYRGLVDPDSFMEEGILDEEKMKRYRAYKSESLKEFYRDIVSTKGKLGADKRLELESVQKMLDEGELDEDRVNELKTRRDELLALEERGVRQEKHLENIIDILTAQEEGKPIVQSDIDRATLNDMVRLNQITLKDLTTSEIMAEVDRMNAAIEAHKLIKGATVERLQKGMFERYKACSKELENTAEAFRKGEGLGRNLPDVPERILDYIKGIGYGRGLLTSTLETAIHALTGIRSDEVNYSYWQQYFYNDLDNARSLDFRRTQTLTRSISDKMKDLGIKSISKYSLIGKTWFNKGKHFNSIAVEIDAPDYKSKYSGEKLKLTPAQAANIYVHSKNDKAKAALTNEAVEVIKGSKNLTNGFLLDNGGHTVARTLTDNDIQSVVDWMNKSENKELKGIVDYLHTIENTWMKLMMDEYSRKVTGSDIAIEDNYHRIVRTNLIRKYIDKGLGNNAAFNTAMMERALESNGALMERQVNAGGTVIVEDFFSAFFNSFKFANQLNAYGEWLRGTKQLLSDTQPVFEAQGTEQFHSYLNKFVGGIEQSIVNDANAFDKAMSFLIGNLNRMYLGANPVVALNQLGSIPLAFQELYVYDDDGSTTSFKEKLSVISKNTVEAFKPEVRKKALEEMLRYSPQLFQRLSQGALNAELGARASAQEMEKVYGEENSNIIDKTMGLIPYMDQTAITMIWESSKELTGGDMVTAAKVAERVTRRTQPTYDAKDRTGLQLASRRNIALTGLTMFTSVPVKIMQMHKTNFVDFTYGKINKKQLALKTAMIAIATAAPLMFFRRLRDYALGREKPMKDNIYEFAFNSISPIPANRLYQILLATTGIGKSTSDLDMILQDPVSQQLETTLKSINKIFNIRETIRKEGFSGAFEDIWDAIGGAVGMATGFPAGAFKNNYKMIRNVAGGEVFEWMYADASNFFGGGEADDMESVLALARLNTDRGQKILAPNKFSRMITESLDGYERKVSREYSLNKEGYKEYIEVIKIKAEELFYDVDLSDKIFDRIKNKGKAVGKGIAPKGDPEENFNSLSSKEQVAYLKALYSEARSSSDIRDLLNNLFDYGLIEMK